MAVTTALLGRHRDAWHSSRGTSGQPAGKTELKCRLLRTSFPNCSFDRYYNFVSSDHVQADARSCFNRARVSAKSLDLRSQRLICATQPLNVCLHSNILLGRQRHFGSCPHRDRNTYGKCGENNHSKDHPRRYETTAPANFSWSSDNVQRDLSHGSKRRTDPRCNPLCPNPLINPVRIYDPAQVAPPRPLQILIPRKCERLVLCLKAASITMNRPQK
jgi:hypothetical protein